MNMKELKRTNKELQRTITKTKNTNDIERTHIFHHLMDNTATQYIQILYYEALRRYMMDSSRCAHPSAWKAVSKAFATPRCHDLEDKARHKAQRASRSTLVWSKHNQWLNWIHAAMEKGWKAGTAESTGIKLLEIRTYGWMSHSEPCDDLRW